MSRIDLQFGWDRDGDWMTSDAVLENGFKVVVFRYTRGEVIPGSLLHGSVSCRDVFDSFELEIWNPEGECEDVLEFHKCGRMLDVYKRDLGSEAIALRHVMHKIASIQQFGHKAGYA